MPTERCAAKADTRPTQPEARQPLCWRLPKPVDVSGLGGLHPVLAAVLARRGVRDWFSAERFLSGREVAASPFAMLDMDRAVRRIQDAIRRGERMIVFGDFDVDGVCSTALLVQTLSALGACVQPYIPDRFAEGYGLNVPSLERLCRQGVKLVVTVDCGIRSVAEVQAANALAVDVIVTDHHEPGPALPPALAVLNPRQAGCPYPNKQLAGVGVAFRLADALLCESPTPWLSPDALLDLVAVGTVADQVSLGNLENRSLVRAGLDRLRRSPRPGLRALFEEAGQHVELADAGSIAFNLAPRLNAAGRLAHADLALRLLSANHMHETYALAAELTALNKTRQALTAQAVTLAESLVDLSSPILLAADASFPPGVLGLVAARLAERYARPAAVVHVGEAISHGSLRAGPARLNVVETLAACAGATGTVALLDQYGGHAAAAGFRLPTHNIPALRERLCALGAGVAGGEDDLAIDAVLEPSQITHDMALALARLEPTGTGNPTPLLYTRNLRLVDVKPLGADGTHLRLHVASDDGEMFEAVAFGMAQRQAELTERLDLAYELTLNYWRGAQRLQLNVRDFREANSE